MLKSMPQFSHESVASSSFQEGPPIWHESESELHNVVARMRSRIRCTWCCSTRAFPHLTAQKSLTALETDSEIRHRAYPRAALRLPKHATCCIFSPLKSKRLVHAKLMCWPSSEPCTLAGFLRPSLVFSLLFEPPFRSPMKRLGPSAAAGDSRIASGCANRAHPNVDAPSP